jgi:hypothetical protein
MLASQTAALIAFRYHPEPSMSEEARRPFLGFNGFFRFDGPFFGFVSGFAREYQLPGAIGIDTAISRAHLNTCHIALQSISRY